MTIINPSERAKMQRQMLYGRPKAAAIDGVRKGVKLADELARNGRIALVRFDERRG